MRSMEAGSVSQIITDPPYGLEFQGAEWDSFRAASAGFKDTKFKDLGLLPSFAPNKHNQKCPECGKWDYDYPDRRCTCGGAKAHARLAYSKAFEDFSRSWLAEAFRVLAPGGTVKAFGGTRTFHRLVVAMTETGLVDVRLAAWGYGSGFPKSLNVGKALDKMARGFPQGGRDPGKRGKGALPNRAVLARGGGTGKAMTGLTAKYDECVLTDPEAIKWSGWGTALKPAWEPILIGRKP